MEASVPSPEPDLKCISDKGLRGKLSKAVTGSALERAFETVVTRTSYKLGSRKRLDLRAAGAKVTKRPVHPNRRQKTTMTIAVLRQEITSRA